MSSALGSISRGKGVAARDTRIYIGISLLLEYLALPGWGEAFKNGQVADAQTFSATYSSA
jgi:hypothetical protein